MDVEELLTVDEAAELLRISRSSVYRLIKGRHIEYKKYPGSATMLTRKGVADFIDASTVPALHQAS